jgi:hypothetical protein
MGTKSRSTAKEPKQGFPFLRGVLLALLLFRLFAKLMLMWR